MPAICQNVRNWHSNAALSSWHTQSLWAGWFTYDLGASERTLNRGNRRRQQTCPDTWKGTILNPRCPEPNQPRVVPPLYDLSGNGVTAIVPQPIPGQTELSLVIADGRDNQFSGQLQSSGRKYTCDEFPPASWIEGGVGIPGTPDSRVATTYCAPWAFKCDSETDARGSEQNWQGYIHGFLGAHLEARAAAENAIYDYDTPIAFRFHYSDQSPTVTWAARIVGVGATILREINPGTPFQRRNEIVEIRSLTNFIPNGNGSLAIELSNGEVVRTHESGAARQALKRVRQRTIEDVEQHGSDASNTTQSPEW